MTILTPEVRALLKRMDADDAINKAIELALEAAAKVCEEKEDEYLSSEAQKWPELMTDAATGCRDCAYSIRALKEQK